MKLRIIYSLIFIIFISILSTGCDGKPAETKQLSSTINGQSNTNELKNEFTEGEKAALKLVEDEYTSEDLFIDRNTDLEPDVYLVSQKVDFGSGLYTTMQAFLIKDGKIIETLYDKDMNLNEKFWDDVDKYKIKTK